MSEYELVPRMKQLDVVGRRVLVRADLDVLRSPQGAVLDDAPLRAILPVLRPLLAQRAKVILASTYRGDDPPEGVARRLGELLGTQATVLGTSFERDAKLLSEGQLALTRSLDALLPTGDADERTAWALGVAGSIDVYVLDGLQAALTGDASVVDLPPLMTSRAAGPLVSAALDVYKEAVEAPEAPYALVLGGSSLIRLLPLVTALLPFCTDILVGGAVANTFLAAQGWKPGGSPVDPGGLRSAQQVLEDARGRGVRMHMPIDAVVRVSPPGRPPTYEVRPVDRGFAPEEAVVDIAVETCNAYREALSGCATALWAGLMGDCSIEETQSGSLRVGEAVGEARRAFVAGEDTLGAAVFFGLDGRLRAVAGGDAGLTLLAGLPLPGLEALKR
jgi:phosphoglycerate kinase